MPPIPQSFQSDRLAELMWVCDDEPVGRFATCEVGSERLVIDRCATAMKPPQTGRGVLEHLGHVARSDDRARWTRRINECFRWNLDSRSGSAKLDGLGAVQDGVCIRRLQR